MKSGERLAMPVSALALAFSAIALPMTYLTVPFCRPAANYISWTATVGIVSAAGAIGLAGMFLSLFSVYSLGNAKARTSLLMAVGSLGVATAFILFGLALRSCPA